MNDHSKSHKKFVTIFLMVLIPIVLFCMSFNYLIDPFFIHHTSLISGVNQTKSCLITHERLFQAVEIAKKKPVAILLGSSRVKEGLKASDMEEITEEEAYNAAFNGANFEEIFHYFEHALYHQPHLKQVVIGLDFSAFNKKVNPQPDFRLDRLKTVPLTWRDFASSLFSQHALKCSYETLVSNFFVRPSPVQENLILKKGDLSFLKMVLSVDYDQYENDEKKIKLFERLVKKCQENSIELKVFFCPMQALYWEAIYQSQLWPAFESLKKKLSAIHPVWDFSGFNCVTTGILEEEIKQPLYFECSHFRPQVGKMMLEKMFLSTNNPMHFGYLLTSQNVDEVLDLMQRQAEHWIKNHHNVLEKIELAQDWATQF